MRRLFHHGMVDRNRRTGLERRLPETQKVQISRGTRQGRAAGVQNIWRESPQLFEQDANRHQEDAAVPCVVTGREKFLCHIRGRLFHEFRNIVDTGRSLKLPANADVTESRCGHRRLDAEQRELTASRRSPSGLDSSLECRGILDPMIHRHRQNDSIRILLVYHQRRDRDRGGSVSAKRLENHRSASLRRPNAAVLRSRSDVRRLRPQSNSRITRGS